MLLLLLLWKTETHFRLAWCRAISGGLGALSFSGNWQISFIAGVIMFVAAPLGPGTPARRSNRIAGKSPRTPSAPVRDRSKVVTKAVKRSSSARARIGFDSSVVSSDSDTASRAAPLAAAAKAGARAPSKAAHAWLACSRPTRWSRVAWRTRPRSSWAARSWPPG